ncbi:hypothetical protein GUJ93_ZPchr0007g4859 [Zizania palustris]|uniref:2-methoxy-6-polyprenyl-1,4-benzoquinol methylase, mitochondrial n=1 Tax=Zizania palustris TaxID=103762 RepID=A0A8J5TF69_ZIZPA|nr:hypothetical protein GUJ93_ZPchr0007g4859 [Zizania palustris]
MHAFRNGENCVHCSANSNRVVVTGTSKENFFLEPPLMALRAASRSLALSSRLLLTLSINSPMAFLHSHATSFEEQIGRLWKDRLISKLNPFPGMKHLDVAGGTGDVAFRVLERINSVSHRAMQGTLPDTEDDTKIYVCDINPNMLNVGKKRASERGYKEDNFLSWIQGDAESLSFDDGSMDGYTIAFGIRNVTHIEKALSEAYRWDT